MNVPGPELTGSNIPVGLIPVPLQAPPDVAAFIVNVPEPAQTGATLVIVGSTDPVTVIVMVDVDGGQGGLSIVHWKVLEPIARPVTPDVGEDGVVTVPVPLIKVHVPVPVVGVFAASVAVVPQIV